MLAASLTADPAAAAKKVDSFFPATSGSGELGGQFNTPRDIAVNQVDAPAGPQDGWIYLADSGNNRIQAFDENREFQFAVGRDVIRSGLAGNVASNERQTVTLSGAAGGTFTLRLGGSSTQTAPIPFDASAAAVQAALEGSTAVGSGNVSVSGGAGGPWTVEFVGALGDRDVTTLSGQAAGLTGTSPAIGVDTPDPGANSVETCVVAADCKAGIAGDEGLMFASPHGLDLDQENGHVFVRDSRNRRVQELTASGAFVKAWGADVALPSGGAGFEVCTVAGDCQPGATTGNTGRGAFGPGNQQAPGIAVVPAGDLGSPNANAGNVLVVDPGNRRVMEFDPAAPTHAAVFVRAWGWDVDSSGGPGSFEICTSACQAGVSGFDGAVGRFFLNQPLHLAVDSDGVAYVTNQELAGTTSPHRLDRFATAASTAAGLAAPGKVSGIFDGVGTTGEVQLEIQRDGQPGGDRMLSSVGRQGVKEFDLDQEPPALIQTHAQGLQLVLGGIAYDSSTDDVYVTAGGLSDPDHRVYVLDDDGAEEPLDVQLDPASEVTTSEATLTGTVNPAGFPATYRFELSTDGVTWTPVAADQSLGTGTSDVPIAASLTDLESNTAYRARVAVTRGFGNGTLYSPEVQFVTEAAGPEVITLPPNHRGATTASLTGSINPNGSATTYYFEYGPTSAYGSVAPAPAAAAGAGGLPLQVAQAITGLTPETAYHYRLVTTSPEGTMVGDDVQFTTRAAVASSSDGRGYELVSPADKIGGQGVGRYLPGDEAAGTPGSPSLDGNRYAVQATFGSTLLDGKFGYATDWAMAERISSEIGWRSHSPFTHTNHGYAGNRFATLEQASGDLSLLVWGSNGRGGLKVFPEQEPLDTIGLAAISDWLGRWEVFAPTTAADGDPETETTGAVSEDGRVTVMQSQSRGLGGPDDPTLGQIPGTLAPYVKDVSGGLSDNIADAAPRRPLSVCTAGTVVPVRDQNATPADDGDDLVGSEVCPANRLIDRRGSEIAPRIPNVVSSDGRRIFFTSPTLGAESDLEPVPCAGRGMAANCPPQLYVYQRRPDGQVVTRWLSRPRVSGQAVDLLRAAFFEGASDDGDKVFFRSRSPLTPDDPNGSCGAPCRTGLTSSRSWDLFMYDFPDDPAADPGAGTLTRVSSGPLSAGTGTVTSGSSLVTDVDAEAGEFTVGQVVSGDGIPGGAVIAAVGSGTLTLSVNATASGTGVGLRAASDGNVSPLRGGQPDSGALRFVSAEGSRSYFVSAAPLSGAHGPSNGTTTAPHGTVISTEAANLYLYDARSSVATRWSFIARMTLAGEVNQCATVGSSRKAALGATNGSSGERSANCVRGTADGGFITFLTAGSLVAADTATPSIDVYAFDAEADELSRISAPKDGAGASYSCITKTGSADFGTPCFGHTGFGNELGEARPRLGVVTRPAVPGDRVAFFQSQSRLVAEDTDDLYDVYQWRNGQLSLLSTGTAYSAHYNGNSEDGRNVFVMTRAPLTWQDHDAVFDIYTARVGGGVPRPSDPAICSALADGCQAPGGGTAMPGVAETDRAVNGVAGNALMGARGVMRIGRLTGRQRARLAAGRVVLLKVSVNAPGRVSIRGTARLGRRSRRVLVASGVANEAGVVRLRLKLSKRGRRQLARDRRLVLKLSTRFSEARRSVSFPVALKVPLPGKSGQRTARGPQRGQQ